MKNFTNTEPQLETIKFQIDDDIFEAEPRIGAGMLADSLNVSGLDDLEGLDNLENVSDAVKLKLADASNKQFLKMMNFLDEVLLPDSAALFSARLRSAKNPIELPQVPDIYQWLLSQYANRPTTPSSPSTNGHDGTGTSLTDGVPVAT